VKRNAPEDTYEPTSLRFRKLIATRTPKKSVYQQYLNQVAPFLCADDDGARRITLSRGVKSPASLGLWTSVLFERHYLVAWVEGNAITDAAPDTDAYVTGLEEGVPIVVAPAAWRTSRSTYLSSILEHEFVHVGQALTGLLRSKPRVTNGDELLEQFFVQTQVEYEAHYLQLVRWPSPRKRPSRIPLDQWILLRAHTAALEEVLHDLATNRFEAELVPDMLDEVPVAARTRLAALGCSRELVAWFEDRWSNDVLTALGILADRNVTFESAPSLGAVAHWLRARSGHTPSPRGAGSKTPRR